MSRDDKDTPNNDKPRTFTVSPGRAAVGAFLGDDFDFSTADPEELERLVAQVDQDYEEFKAKQKARRKKGPKKKASDTSA